MAKAKRRGQSTGQRSNVRPASNAPNPARPTPSAPSTPSTTPTQATREVKNAPPATTRAAGLSPSARAARERRQSAKGPQPRSRMAPKPWWRRNAVSLGVVGAVVVIIAALIIWSQHQAQVQNQAAAVGIGDPAPAAVLQPLTSVSPTLSAKVGDGGVQSPLKATPRNTPLLTASGKPEIIYVGTDWCPFCAATRWSTVMALSRFGSFSGLTLMRSSATDTLANTATFSFQKATYTSQYIVFSATETQDRNGTALATPPAAAASAQATYDVSPYTSSPGGIPFMSYGNQYVQTSGLFVPTMLQGLSWQQIAQQLNDPNSSATKAIVGGANIQTAAICKLTNNQPGSVCDAPVIQQLEAALPQAK